MKKYVVLFFLILVNNIILSQNSNNCFEGGLILTSQAEIDDIFKNNSNCRTVNGGLLISGQDINNLDGLKNLSKIEGTLNIVNNQFLNDIKGLENLKSILSLGLVNNNNLTNLDGLNNLNSIEKNIKIINNHKLETINAIRNIKFNNTAKIIISGNINLSKCVIKNLCSNLENLVDITINDNAEGCSNLNELNLRCKNIDCPTKMSYNYQKEIDDFSLDYPNCNSFVGDLIIHSKVKQDPITSLKGFINLKSISGSLTIFNNKYLTNLSGLEGLESFLGGLWIENNNNLTKINALKNIESLKINDIKIKSNKIKNKDLLFLFNHIDSTFDEIIVKPYLNETPKKAISNLKENKNVVKNKKEISSKSKLIKIKSDKINIINEISSQEKDNIVLLTKQLMTDYSNYAPLLDPIENMVTKESMRKFVSLFTSDAIIYDDIREFDRKISCIEYVNNIFHNLKDTGVKFELKKIQLSAIIKNIDNSYTIYVTAEKDIYNSIKKENKNELSLKDFRNLKLAFELEIQQNQIKLKNIRNNRS